MEKENVRVHVANQLNTIQKRVKKKRNGLTCGKFALICLCRLSRSFSVSVSLISASLRRSCASRRLSINLSRSSNIDTINCSKFASSPLNCDDLCEILSSDMVGITSHIMFHILISFYGSVPNFHLKRMNFFFLFSSFLFFLLFCQFIVGLQYFTPFVGVALPCLVCTAQKHIRLQLGFLFSFSIACFLHRLMVIKIICSNIHLKITSGYTKCLIIGPVRRKHTFIFFFLFLFVSTRFVTNFCFASVLYTGCHNSRSRI